MSRESFIADVRRNFKPKFVTTRSNIADGAPVDAVPIPPSPIPDENLLAVLIQGSVKISNTGTNSFIVVNTTGADPLDFFVLRQRVKPDEGGTDRSKAINRYGVEAIEQIAFNLQKQSYPRAAKCISSGADVLPTTNKIANATTNFLNAEWLIPVGAKSAAIEIDTPTLPLIGAGTTNATISAKGIIATSSRQLRYKAIYGKDPTVVTFDQRITYNLTNGNDNSLVEYQPKNMAPHFYGIRNVAKVSKIQAEAPRKVAVNMTRGDFAMQQLHVPDLAPTFSSSTTPYTPSTSLMWLGTNRSRFATYVATLDSTTTTLFLDLLAIEFADGPSTDSPPPETPDQIPDTPASQNVPGPSANASTAQGARRIYTRRT